MIAIIRVVWSFTRLLHRLTLSEIEELNESMNIGSWRAR